jgi:acyl carrier protein
MTTTNASLSIEETIKGYWRELLGVEAVKPTDHFIGLGGNSMLATLLANRIEDDLGVRLEIVELFATFAQVAERCSALTAQRVSRGDA